jgi:carboxyl-terminal processing protease
MLESVRENGGYETMRRRKTILPYLSLVVLTALAFFIGYLARAAWPPPGEELRLVREAKRLLEAHYLDPLPESIELERGMIRGMVNTLDDPFTTLVDPAAHELQRDDLSGEYGGIGAIITRDEAGLVHLAPFEDSPAERAGIEEGDILFRVDDFVIDVQTRLEEISAAIRGPLGTEVTLLMSETEDPEDASEVRILRESIPLPSVTSYAHPDDPAVGVLAITIFSEKTPDEVEEHYSSLMGEGVTGLVLDLRGNSGGLLDSAIEVARFFLDEGLILKEIQSESKLVEHNADSPGAGASIPLSVLVNGGTASAAEIVAGALQANGRAPLIGQKTFGKGSVQLVFELSDGSSLHVTSARWLTANGIALDQIGLEPDIPLETEDGTKDIILQEALESLRTSNED